MVGFYIWNFSAYSLLDFGRVNTREALLKGGLFWAMDFVLITR